MNQPPRLFACPEPPPSVRLIAMVAASDPTVGTKKPVAAKPAERKRSKPRKLPPYHVVLLDDDHHSFEYVIVMMAKLFGHNFTRGYQIAHQVDKSGRAIVLTTTKEHAELKRDQILGFGADPLIASSETAMRAVIEPAPES